MGDGKEMSTSTNPQNSFPTETIFHVPPAIQINCLILVELCISTEMLIVTTFRGLGLWFFELLTCRMKIVLLSYEYARYFKLINQYFKISIWNLIMLNLGTLGT